MFGDMIHRSRSSLIHADGTGCSFSGRQMPLSQQVHKFARRSSRRVVVRSEYQGGRYQGEQRGSSATTQQQRRPQTEYDYDFPPPPGMIPLKMHISAANEFTRILLDMGSLARRKYEKQVNNFAGSSQQPPRPPNGGPPRGPGGGGDGNSNIKNYLIAGAFFIGIGTGVWFDSSASFTPNNVASTEIVDRKQPNSEICIASGYSSMVFDQRLFVSFNP